MNKMKQFPGFICEYCGKSFPDEKSMSGHQLSHDVELVNKVSTQQVVPPHLAEVPLSGHSMASNNSINSVINSAIHPTSVSTNITHHDMKAGAKVKAHACEQCGKSYTRKDHLNRHKLEHTGVKPHVCCICMKAFIRKDKLQRHERIHMKDQDAKFGCSVCGKHFLRKDGLNKHIKTHSLECTNKSKPMETDKDRKPSPSEMKNNTVDSHSNYKYNIVSQSMEADVDRKPPPSDIKNVNLDPHGNYKYNVVSQSMVADTDRKPMPSDIKNISLDPHSNYKYNVVCTETYKYSTCTGPDTHNK
ncbi:Vascular endothelial zinc finger 1 [Mactra antiquata]